MIAQNTLFRAAAPARVCALARRRAPRRRAARSPRLPGARRRLAAPAPRRVACRATEEKEVDVDKELAKSAGRSPGRSSRARARPGQEPGFKGSTLYTIFEVQAYVSLVVGALLSYNAALDEQHRAARACGQCGCSRCRRCARASATREKDRWSSSFRHPARQRAHPDGWKSFPAVFTADCVLLAYMYYNKGAGTFDDGEEAAVEGSEE